MTRRFSYRISTALTVLFFCSSTVLAQKLAPSFPRDGAKKLDENAMVIVWDVTWEKGKPTAMQERLYDQFVVTLNEGAVKVTRPDKTWTIEQTRLGSVRFESKGTVAAEEGISDKPARAIVVEFKSYAVPKLEPKVAQDLKEAKEKGIPGQLPRKGAVKLFETERVSVWDNSWPSGPPQDMHVHYANAIGVFVQGGTVVSASASAQGGQPGTGTARAVGYVNIGSPRAGAHAEGASQGSPRAIFIELK